MYKTNFTDDYNDFNNCTNNENEGVYEIIKHSFLSIPFSMFFSLII